MGPSLNVYAQDCVATASQCSAHSTRAREQLQEKTPPQILCFVKRLTEFLLQPPNRLLGHSARLGPVRGCAVARESEVSRGRYELGAYVSVDVLGLRAKLEKPLQG